MKANVSTLLMLALSSTTVFAKESTDVNELARELSKRSMRSRNFLFVSALALLLPGVSGAQVPSGEPYDFLRTQIGYTETELRAIADGQAVTKVLDTAEPREIAISGVVRLRASTSYFLRMFRDIERFDTAALAIRKLSDPVQPGDFAAMEIPDASLKALPGCTPGDCDMKLGEETLRRVQTEVDWSDAGAVQKAEAILQEQALHYARAYLDGGNAALGGYHDKKKPGLIDNDFEALLENAPYILQYRPELHRYLLDYPKAELDGATDFLFWAQYDYGKPVIRVNHVTIYPTEEGENGSALVTSKHLWYTHYFTTGLDLYALVRDPKAEREAFYLVNLTRMRTDGIGSGMFGRMLKKSVAESVVKNVQGYLTSMKSAIEQYYQDSRARGR